MQCKYRDKLHLLILWKTYEAKSIVQYNRLITLQHGHLRRVRRMKNGGVWRRLAGSLLRTRQIYLCGAVSQSSTSISTTALRPLSIYIVTPFWLLVLNNSFLSIFSLFLSLFLICFAFNMHDFIWEKRRSRFSRQLKEQNIFSYCRNCIFCYFSAFFCTSESTFLSACPYLHTRCRIFCRQKKNRHFYLFLVLDIEIFLGGITIVKLFENI